MSRKDLTIRHQAIAVFQALVAGERSGDLTEFDALTCEESPLSVGFLLEIGEEHMVGPIWDDCLPKHYARPWYIPEEAYAIRGGFNEPSND